MPRKKSVKHAAKEFRALVDETQEVLSCLPPSSSAKLVTWMNDYAVIRLYRAFEQLMQSALIGAINNDTSTISDTVGFPFPRHLSDEVCEYLVVGRGYFDFKGYDGLIKLLKQYVPESHYLVTLAKKPKHKRLIAKLTALRNFAAHDSKPAKKSAQRTLGVKRIKSSGAWLKRQERFLELATSLKVFATELEAVAPY